MRSFFGRHIWTPDEDSNLREMYPHCDILRIAEFFGVTKDAVSQRARFLEVKKRPPRVGYVRKTHKWSDEDLEVLRKLYPHHSNRYVAKKLGLSERQVGSTANKCGIYKANDYKQPKHKKEPFRKKEFKDFIERQSALLRQSKNHTDISIVNAKLEILRIMNNKFNIGAKKRELKEIK